MPRTKLTNATLERRCKVPKTGQVDYFDSAFPSLALRVSATGYRSWLYFGRIEGRLRRVTLGRWSDLTVEAARREAGRVADLMRRGIDPRTIDTSDTVAAAVTLWLKRDQVDNRSHDRVRQLFDRVVIPAWGQHPIGDVRKRDVIALVERVADRAPTIGNRTLAHVRRFFRWSLARDLVEVDPTAGVQMPARETSRDRVLTDHELVLVWNATSELGRPFGPITQLLILTGAPRDEVGSLTWDEVDLDRRVIRLSGQRSKNGEARLIPLSGGAAAVLRGVPPRPGYNSVFGRLHTSAGASGWSVAKARLDRLAGVKDWWLHDLRRTVATGLERLGTPIQVTEAVLGHVSGSKAGIVGIYQRHRYEREAAEALDKWWEHVRKLVGAVDVLTVGQLLLTTAREGVHWPAATEHLASLSPKQPNHGHVGTDVESSIIQRVGGRPKGAGLKNLRSGGVSRDRTLRFGMRFRQQSRRVMGRV